MDGLECRKEVKQGLISAALGFGDNLDYMEQLGFGIKMNFAPAARARLSFSHNSSFTFISARVARTILF